jgi:hypothetical protein
VTARPFRLVETVASKDELHATVKVRSGDIGSAIVERWSANFDVPAERRSAVPPMLCRTLWTWAWLLMRHVP